MNTKFLPENLKEREYLEVIGMGGRKRLKLAEAVIKEHRKVWNPFCFLRTDTL